MTDGEQKTVEFVIEASAGFLAGRSVEAPRRVAELLLCRLLACNPPDLLFRRGEALSEAHLGAMRRGVRRAAEGEPVQYILGAWDFMGHEFKVDRRALIPRPETELLVERALACAEAWEDRDGGEVLAADVGTGSGCIAVSLALARPAAAILAVDTSREALTLAEENAAKLGASGRIRFLHGELCDLVEPESLALIVANLPYISTTDYERLPPHIRNYEPRSALDGGAEGLDHLRLLIADAPMALRQDGRLFMEIGAEQGAAVSDMLETLGFQDVRLIRDLAGHDRIVEAKAPPV